MIGNYLLRIEKNFEEVIRNALYLGLQFTLGN
jgi:hypothetical protein